MISEAVKVVHQTEPDTTHYEWSVSADGSELFIYERYADSDAALAHLKTFAPFANRFADSARTKRFRVFGFPNDALRQALADANPEYARQISANRRMT